MYYWRILNKYAKGTVTGEAVDSLTVPTLLTVLFTRKYKKPTILILLSFLSPPPPPIRAFARDCENNFQEKNVVAFQAGQVEFVINGIQLTRSVKLIWQSYSFYYLVFRFGIQIECWYRDSIILKKKFVSLWEKLGGRRGNNLATIGNVWKYLAPFWQYLSHFGNGFKYYKKCWQSAREGRAPFLFNFTFLVDNEAVYSWGVH